MTLETDDLQHGFQLGECRIEPSRNRIVRPDGEAHLEPKVMEVLICLAGQAGEVVPRRRLEEAVWGDAIVSDQALTNCISELRRHLGDDRAGPRFIETVPKRGYRLVSPVSPLVKGEFQEQSTISTGWLLRAWRLLAGAGIATLLAVLVAFSWWSMSSTGRSGLTSVAVLPFQNVSGNERLDYLRLALPDEVTTVLTHAKGLAVRPFEPSRDDHSQPTHQVEHLVTGHFYLEASKQLSVAIEARNVEREQLVWRARIAVSIDDLIALRQEITDRVKNGLAPVLGATYEQPILQPTDAEAYRLYLHSLAVPRDPGPNRKGVELLEKAIELDPDYASAWAALAHRYSHLYNYGGADEQYIEMARQAAERALEIEPGFVTALHRLIIQETHSGRLASAYDEARKLVIEREDSAEAHFALAYVFRYGGLLQYSQRHCEVAMALDPHNYRWRSCAFAYMTAGELDRADRFIKLDQGSYWSNLVSVHYWLRRGDKNQALQYAKRLPPGSVEQRFHLACLRNYPEPPPQRITAQFIDQWTSLVDPEPSYWIGSEMVYCARSQEALMLLEDAIKTGYCSYPGVARDPAWAPLRKKPEFQRLAEKAKACHERFRGAVENAPYPTD